MERAKNGAESVFRCCARTGVQHFEAEFYIARGSQIMNGTTVSVPKQRVHEGTRDGESAPRRTRTTKSSVATRAMS